MKPTYIKIKRSGFKSLILALGLVIGGLVVVLAVLKGIFNIDLAFFRTTLNLKPTTLRLEDIQDLEFLVTAEYFGEVIGTARDYFSRRTIPQAESLLLRLMNSADPEAEKLSAEETEIMNALRGALIKRSNMSSRVINNIYDLKSVLNFARPEFQNDRLSPALKDLVLEMLLAKRDIAYLARGSVQAGYSLKGLAADKYFYCPSTKTLFLNMEVQIFSRQINPWFIYDAAANNYVKGFEIISQTNIDLEDEGIYDFIKNIKEQCQQRLADDAVREGIKAQARESAERTLENTLKMLKSDVRTVRILAAAEFENQKNVCPESGKPVISSR
jgi:hypothetical protein